MTQRLTETHRPQSLRQIVGQPAVAMLRVFATAPYASCWLFQGQPGNGKTSTALALARDLGCDPQFDCQVLSSSELNAEAARQLVQHMRLRPWNNGHWRVFILEELERLHPTVQVLLKVALETQNLPPHCIVVATSNDTSALPAALLQRFNVLTFESRERFARACCERLQQIWAEQAGPTAALPRGWQHWGYVNGEQGHFSMRVALDQMQMQLLRARAEQIDRDELAACAAGAL